MTHLTSRWRKRRERRTTYEVPPLTLGLWLDVLRAVGVAHPKGVPVPGQGGYPPGGYPPWEAETAPLDECASLAGAVLGAIEPDLTAETLRALAAALWTALRRQAEADLARASATTDALERSLGHFLDGGQSVTLARVLYALDPSDLDALLAWPLWRAVEWMTVRGVENDFQEENRRLGSVFGASRNN